MGATLHDLTPLFRYALWFYCFPYRDLFVSSSFTFAGFNPCSFLPPCVHVTLAVFASTVPRLQCSQDMPHPLADEHTLIASYVARLQHCTRLVARAAAAAAAPGGSAAKAARREGGRELWFPGLPAAAAAALCMCGVTEELPAVIGRVNCQSIGFPKRRSPAKPGTHLSVELESLLYRQAQSLLVPERLEVPKLEHPQRRHIFLCPLLGQLSLRKMYIGKELFGAREMAQRGKAFGDEHDNPGGRRKELVPKHCPPAPLACLRSLPTRTHTSTSHTKLKTYINEKDCFNGCISYYFQLPV